MCQSHIAIWVWLRSGLVSALDIIVQHLSLVLCHMTLEMWLFQVEMGYQCEVTTGSWKLNIWREKEEENNLSNYIQMISLGYTVLTTSPLVKCNSVVSSAFWKVWLLRNEDLQLWRWRASSGDLLLKLEDLSLSLRTPMRKAEHCCARLQPQCGDRGGW